MRTRVRTTALAVVAAAATAATLLVAGPAGAEGDTANDPVRDVHFSPYEEGDDEIRPNDRKRDIDVMRSKHAHNRVVFNFQMRQLTETSAIFQAAIGAPGSQEYRVDLTLPFPDPEPVLYSLEANPRFGGQEIPCKGLDHDLLLGKDRVRLVVPAACIGNPNWVRTGGTVYNLLENGTVRDDARLVGEYHSTIFSKLGPRLSEN